MVLFGAQDSYRQWSIVVKDVAFCIGLPAFKSSDVTFHQPVSNPPLCICEMGVINNIEFNRYRVVGIK